MVWIDPWIETILTAIFVIKFNELLWKNSNDAVENSIQVFVRIDPLTLLELVASGCNEKLLNKFIWWRRMRFGTLREHFVFHAMFCDRLKRFYSLLSWFILINCFLKVNINIDWHQTLNLKVKSIVPCNYVWICLIQ